MGSSNVQVETPADRVKHESAIADAVIEPQQRSRFVEVAKARRMKRTGTQTPLDLKRARKYRQALANLENWLDPRCELVKLAKRDRRAAARSKLLELGVEAPGYVMSESQEIDGCMMEVDEVLAFLAANQTSGTLIFWPDPGVAYYEQSERAELTMLMLGIGVKP